MKLKTEFIDSDRAERLLGITLGDRAVFPSTLVKSFYQFNFDTADGIKTFLTILPLADKEVLQQAQEQLLPQSVDDTWDIYRARFELRGLLLDLLNEDPEGIEEQPVEEGLEVTDEEEGTEEGEVDDGGL